MDYQSNCQNRPQPEAKFPYVDSRSYFCSCSVRLLCLFGALLALALGFIFGSVFAAEVLPALYAIIIFAVVMAVAILAVLIYRYCLCCRARRCN